MDLEKTWHLLDGIVSSLDFERIWPGFAPLKFALYDSEKCFFDGRWVEKTDAFTANTSILYEGEQIAIWYVQEEIDPAVFASKIVHEMFHGFQNQKGWDCWPNEREALFRYRYDAGDVALKLRENELLTDLLEGPDDAALSELFALRKRRAMACPYESDYEAKAEEIEGTANYVEWQVLRQLDEKAASALAGRMCAFLSEPKNLIPVRVSCYFRGALMIHALRQAGRYDFDPPARPYPPALWKDVPPAPGDFPGREEKLARAQAALGAYEEETARIVQDALRRNETVLQGPAELASVNVYDARRWENYLTSTYFLMILEETGMRVIPGDFLVEMEDEKTIRRALRL